MRTHIMTCWVTVGKTLGNAEALVDTLIDTEPEMEELSVGDTWGGAQGWRRCHLAKHWAMPKQ